MKKTLPFNLTSLLVTIALLLSLCANAQITPTAGIVYVTPNGTGDGSSWANAHNELAEVLEQAKTNTAIKEIWVAKGTYLPMYAPVATDESGSPVTDQDKTFMLVKDVKIYGGFDPDGGKTDMATRDPRQAMTILSGNLGATGVNTDNAYHVVLSVGAIGTAELNGFTISDGYAFGGVPTLNINAKTVQRYVGAGIYLVESSPVIKQVNVSNNMAMASGAGMYLTYSSSALTNVRIHNNTTYGDGGAMFNANSSPILTNVLIDNNSASGRGGGMVNGISSPVLTNVTMTNNMQGALVNHSGSNPVIRNSVIYGNTTYNIWNVNLANDKPVFSYSLVQGSGGSTAWNANVGTDGSHNIDIDPMFVDAVNRNYRLQVGSLAADVGDNTLFYASSTPNLSAITTDLDGNSRISEGTIDLGAYEIMVTPPVTITPDGSGIAYVRSLATGLGNGSSWDDATADLQGAIYSGAVQVFVAIGNYNVPLARNGFTMKNGVQIYGGFDPDNNIKVLGNARILPNKLASFGGGSVLNGQNIRGVIWNEFTAVDPLDNTAILDGFTIMNGTATDGGGIYNLYASPTLTNLVIKNNTASVRGGGVFTWEASPVLSDLVVINNTAADNGGGVYTGRSSDLKMSNVLVKGNTGSNGGGIYHFDTQGTLTNVAVIGNNATGTNTGSALETYSGTNHFVNVTIAGNTGHAFHNGAAAFLDNSIVYGGIDGLGYTAQYSLIEGKNNNSDGNINAMGITLSDIFNAPGSGDYTLSSSSAAVNAGSNNLFVDLDADTKDLAGNPRLFGARIDLGAYELQVPAVIVITPDAEGIAYVKPVATGTGRGDSWDDATGDLQGAINSGATKVFVAVGIHPVPSSGSFVMKDGVEIYGGFDPDNQIEDLDERILPNHLSPFGGGSVLLGQNQHSVVANSTLSNTAVLDGFTITGGKDQVMGGGGIANISASPVLSNLVIKENAANWDGGGIYNFSSSPVLSNVVLLGNTAISGWGGAMSNWDNSNPVLVNVLMSDNVAADFGGAIYNFTSSPQLTNVTITGNEAVAGSAIYNEFGSSPQVHNSIIYGHTGQGIFNANSVEDNPAFSFSLVQGSGGSTAWITDIGIDGGSNIDVDPLFGDVANSDYTLQAGSPAVNGGNKELFAGLNAYTKDLSGHMRLIGTNIDMGVYELQSQPQVINPISDITKTYGDADFAPAATASSGLEVSYSSADNSIAEAYQDTTDSNKWKLKIKKAGTVSITASQPGGGGYLPATDVEFDLVVQKKKVTVSFTGDPVIKVYDGTVDGSITVSNLHFASGDIVRGDDVQIQLATTAISYDTKNVGFDKVIMLTLSSVVIAGTDIDNYELSNSTDLSASIGTITAAPLTVTVNNGQGKVYGNVDPVLTYQVTGFKGTDDESVLIGALTRAIGEDVGNYTITQGDLSAGDNYAIDFLGNNFTISKATITGITFNDANYVYDGTAKSLAITGTLPQGASVSYTGNAQTNAGTYNVAATINGGTNYNNLTLNAVLTIGKATITGITFTDANYVYDGSAKSLAIAGSLPQGASVSYTGNAQTNAGTYNVVANINGGANYNNLTLNAVLTIDKATITGITFTDASYVYDGNTKSLAIAGTLPQGASVSYTGNARTNAGIYNVAATINGGTNYNNLTLNAVLTIGKASITGITFTDASYVYDGNTKSLAIAGTLPQGVSVSYTGNTQTNAGTYNVVATINGGTNYNNLTLNAVLTISKATITGITFTDASYVYDGSAKSLAVAGTLPQGASVSYTGNAQTNAGTYNVVANINGGTNYNNLTLDAVLTIDKAAIIGITFDDASYVYDGNTKSLAIAGTLPQGASVSYTGNARTNAGTYSITANINGGQNYYDRILNATLTINKAPQTITFVSPGTLGRDAGTVALDVTASSGLPIQLAIDDEMIATLSGMSLNVLRLGTVTITATQSGNENYLPAEPASITVKIANYAGSKIPIRVHKAVSPNGDGINEFLMLEGIGDYPENRVTIFDKSGKILAEIESYDNHDRVFTGQYVNDGTYYYYLDIKDGNIWKREKGFFVVRRNTN